MERRLVSSQEECQRLCFEHILKCQSFEFNTITTQCDLYDVPAPEGVLALARSSKLPFSVDDPIDDKKKDISEYSYKLRAKRQIDLQDPLKLPQFPNYCEPEVVPAIGTNFMIPKFECAPSSQLSPTESLLEPFSSSSNSRTRFHVPTSGQNAISIIPDMPDCRDGGRARIQLIDGITLLMEKKPVAKIQVDSAQYLDGNRFPRPCVGATFDRSTGRCTIMDDAITPNGQLQYAPERETVYFEKICIPLAELPANCEDIVHRIPQRVMEGSHDATVDAQTQVECIRKCITASVTLW
uniref:Apple domain-containing protein n=1 Tax=Panagrolaimus superbus TaxID=310955 RepID=A0A914YNW1_9BILA